jgi:hypothetical protein
MLLAFIGLGIAEIIILLVVLGGGCAAVLLMVLMTVRSSQSRGTASRMVAHAPALVESDGVLRVQMPLGPEWADRWVRVVVEPGDRV